MGRVIGDALDHLAGTWSEADLREFEEAVRVTERIDDALWSVSSASNCAGSASRSRR